MLRHARLERGRPVRVPAPRRHQDGRGGLPCVPRSAPQGWRPAEGSPHGLLLGAAPLRHHDHAHHDRPSARGVHDHLPDGAFGRRGDGRHHEPVLPGVRTARGRRHVRGDRGRARRPRVAAEAVDLGHARGHGSPGGHGRRGDRVCPRNGGAAHVRLARRGSSEGEGVLRTQAEGRLRAGAGRPGRAEALRARVQPRELRRPARLVRPVPDRRAPPILGAHAAGRRVHDLRRAHQREQRRLPHQEDRGRARPHRRGVRDPETGFDRQAACLRGVRPRDGERVVLLRRRVPRDRRRDALHPRGHDLRARGTERIGQDHAREPARPLLGRR